MKRCYFLIFLLSFVGASLAVPTLPPDQWVLPETPGGNEYDRLGASIAAQGEWAVMGAPDDDTAAGGEDAGSVSLFQRQGTGWVHRQTLEGPVTASTCPGEFGQAVALAEGWLLVGAPATKTSVGEQAGAVYVFKLAGAVWRFHRLLLSPSAHQLEGFGHALALAGTRAAVSMKGDEGKVCVLALHGEDWRVEATLMPPNKFADWPVVVTSNPFYGNRVNRRPFGWSLALSGDTLLVGAPEHQAAYVYERVSGQWRWQQTLDSPSPAQVGEGVSFALPPYNSQSRDYFGGAVAVDGDVAVIGAGGYYQADHSGVAYCYRRSAGQWVLAQRLLQPISSDGKWFGLQVALKDGVLAVTQAQAPGIFSTAGVVHLFWDRGGSWVQQAQLIKPSARYGEFGAALCLAEGQLWVGFPCLPSSPFDNQSPPFEGGVGHVYSTAGIKTGELAVPLALLYRYGQHGRSLAAAGNWLAVSAPNDRDEQGIRCGSVRIYQSVNKAWVFHTRLFPPTADRVRGMEFGYQVALSAGQVLACSTAGGYLFTLDTAQTTWTQAAKLTLGSGLDGAVSSAALTKDHAYFGLPSANSGAGRVDIFYRPRAGAWQLQTSLSSTLLDDRRFGHALSACELELFQGSALHLLAVGAPGNALDVGSVSQFSCETPPFASNPSERWMSEGRRTAVDVQWPGQLGTAVSMTIWGAFATRQGEEKSSVVALSGFKRVTSPGVTLPPPSGASPGFGAGLSVFNVFAPISIGSTLQILVGDSLQPTVGGGYLFDWGTQTSRASLRATLRTNIFYPTHYGVLTALTGDHALLGASLSGNPADFTAPWTAPHASLQQVGKTVTAVQGQSRSLSVPALAGATYVWYRDGFALGTGDPSHFTGANSATLTLVNAAREDAGHYSVRVHLAGRTYELTGFDVEVVERAAILPGSLGPWTVATRVQGALLASSAVTRFTVSGLPPGVRLNAQTGEFSGQPTTAGSFSLRCQAMNAAGTGPVTTFPVLVQALPVRLTGAYAGLIELGQASQTGGGLAFQISSSGAFTLQTTLGAHTYRRTGTLTRGYDGGFVYESEFWTTFPSLEGFAGTSQSVQLRWAAGQQDFGGRLAYFYSSSSPLYGGIRYVPLSAAPVAEGGRRSTTRFAGRYTALLDAGSARTVGNVPHGPGYGLMQITPNGTVTWVGRLGDGSPVTTSTVLTRPNRLPLHLASHAGRAVTQGWLSLERGTRESLALVGSMDWVHQGSRLPNRRWLASFSATDLSVRGGFYAPPANGQVPLGLSNLPGNATLFLSDEAVGGAPLSARLTLRPGQATALLLPPNSQHVRLQIYPNTGAFTGSFTRPSTRQTAVFSGVLVPSLGIGGGHYALPSQWDEYYNVTLTTGDVLLRAGSN